MAYGCILASVPPQQVDEYQRHAREWLSPTRQDLCSHLTAYWVKAQPLGDLLVEAIDGGEPLREDLWHPLHPPAVHGPAEVRRISDRLGGAWAQAVESGLDYPEGEIKPVLDIFAHAALHNECIVRFLDRPMDEEQANRVIIPLVPVSV